MTQPNSTSFNDGTQLDAQSVRRRRLWIVVLGLLFFGAGGAYFVYDSGRYSEDDVQNEAFPNSMQRVGR